MISTGEPFLESKELFLDLEGPLGQKEPWITFERSSIDFPASRSTVSLDRPDPLSYPVLARFWLPAIRMASGNMESRTQTLQNHDASRMRTKGLPQNPSTGASSQKLEKH
jgi:hypothetical protein